MSLDIALSVLLICSAACYALLGMRLVQSNPKVGSRPIGVLFVVISIWVVGGAIELLADSYSMFSIGRTGHFVGTALVPIVAYVCFREYTGTEMPTSRMALILVIPTISIVLAATNQYHELMWFAPFVNEAGQYLTRPDKWGPWFLFAHLPYSYAVILAAIITLLAHSSAVAPAHRRGLLLMSAACIAPLIATAAYDIGVGPNTISYVPIVFAGMLPIYAWLIIGERIIEVTPVAYETVFQTMQDPVVVIDDQNRVIGLNHTAENMLSISEAKALRMPLKRLFGTGSYEVHEALESGEPRKMMTDTGRFLHVQVSRIDSHTSAARGGQVLMFRDVSDVERAQSEVRKNEKLLRTLIDHSVNGVVRFSWVEGEDGNRELRSVFANAAAGRFLATDTTHLVDSSATQIIRLAVTGMDDSLVEDIMERFARFAENGENLDIEVRQQADGRARWLRVICEPVGDDYAATFVDITDGKAKERPIRLPVCSIAGASSATPPGA
jgi:PAS domain-containing protein